ncbi:hypothetical protein QFZ75_003663 [Streptomyces sp. V3I8]|uniref:hypothetical protein n=1 Tax=Streptomyces sp. V3I8 TaxID=3042279 RepID=UPI002787D0F7|nr:hypothetical protein [Streptomyces sp. V3I8]MDQ1037247.1 hypothetical protein [Streptomyces sp. V3I8]
MSDALDKAEDAAREAAADTDVLRIVAAVLATQQAVQQQTPAPPAPCQHDHGRRSGRSAGEWIGLSCAVCIGGVGIAFASIAIAIGGMSVAILAIVLRSMWRDIKKGR